MLQLPENLQRLSTVALLLADIARPISRQYFRQTLDIEQKTDHSPVTIADRSVETAMRTYIETEYPDHGIFGEEHGRANTSSEHIWVLDPIDGTKSFITGMPTFGTLIAHLYREVPVLGIIDIPATRERWQAIAGQAALFNGTQCNTSDCQRLAQASLYTTSPDSFDAAGRAAFERVSAQARMRRFGGDCYSYGLLASGHIDAVMEMSLQPYDYMAMIPIIEAAGGVISDWQGKPLTLQSDGHVIAAASQQLHQEILALIGS